MPLHFVGPASPARSLHLDAQRSVNLYLEADQTGKNPIALFGTPGCRRVLTLPTGPVRGLINAGGTLQLGNGGATGSIVLTSGQLAITESVSIEGPGASVLTVDGDDSSQVFYVYNSSTLISVSLSGLTITGGDINNGTILVRNGKIELWRDYFDLESYRRQRG
mgnify:CR=1 FL=1